MTYMNSSVGKLVSRHCLPGLRAVAALLLCASVSWAAAVLDASARPNIILCMADDQGWGDVGYYGKSIAKTPVLDEMESGG